jgi:hypothetical protein
VTDRLDNFDLRPFISGPAEFLVVTIAEQLMAVKQFALIFGEFIDPYMRRDYPDRNLPVMRVYNERYQKENESWFETGDIKIDVIFPPSIRRQELQQLQDTISAALIQQFRRTPFFNAVSTQVPGLNELGKVFTVDKTLGFEWNDELIVPLTQMTANFRLDLRIWDDYLESTNRTKDDPFEYTLANLERIYSTIQAQNDQGKVDITVPMQQTV